MNFIRTVITSLLFLVSGPFLFAEPPERLEPPLQFLVPAYFYPAGEGLTDWNKLCSAAKKVPVVAIVNPSNGPGKQVDSSYQKVVKKAKNSGVKLIGYVSSNYSKRPLGEIKEDMKRWIDFYPEIEGFFIDEQAWSEKEIDYYKNVSEFAHEILNAPLIVSNPGAACQEGYIKENTADVFCIFETHSAFTSSKLPKWTSTKRAQQMSVLAYEIGASREMVQCLHDAFDSSVKYVYFTDDTRSNPWDRLPTYWEKEVTAMKGLLNREAKRRESDRAEKSEK